LDTEISQGLPRSKYDSVVYGNNKDIAANRDADLKDKEFLSRTRKNTPTNGNTYLTTQNMPKSCGAFRQSFIKAP
jgi:hypothetical protein